MEIVSKDEIMDNCIDKALELIGMVIKDNEQELQKKFITDPVFHNVVRHIADMYFEFETNKNFKTQQEGRRIEALRRLGNMSL